MARKANIQKPVAAVKAPTNHSALAVLNRPIVDYVCYLIIFLMTGVLILAVSGEQVGRKFGVKALYNEEGGVYADCSRPENRNNPYCKPKGDAVSDEDWKRISKHGKTVPFQLN